MQKTKFLVLFLIALSFTPNVLSQTKQVPNLLNFDNSPYHFGFLLGVNKMLFTIKTPENYKDIRYYNNLTSNSMPDLNSDSANIYNIESTPTYGFVIGIIGNLRMGNYFDLRFTPALTFGERYIDYDILNYYDSPTGVIQYESKNIQSTFVDFPLWIRFKGDRIHNIRPYILAGAKYSIDLASNAKKKSESNVANVFLDRNDIYGLGGVGFDFYTAYFKFGTEITMSYGIFNILKKDNTIYTKGIDRLSSKLFQISFTFE